MSEYDEWNRKEPAVSDVTAQKDYGVSRDFIVEGIRAGKLQYREDAASGDSSLRVLRSELERYIAEQFGSEYLVNKKSRARLRAISREIADLEEKLAALSARKISLERALKP